MLGHRLEICFSANLHSHGLTAPFQWYRWLISLDKVVQIITILQAHPCEFQPLLLVAVICLLISWAWPYLVLTTAKCNETWRYLRMEAALMSPPNFRATSLCSSTEFVLSFSNHRSRYSKISLVIFEGRPSLKSSCRPWSWSQWNIQRRTVPANLWQWLHSAMNLSW